MSHAFWRRLLITALSLLVGLLLAEGIRRLFFAQSNGWILFFLCGILAVALGSFLDGWLTSVSSKRTSSLPRLEADLLQLNRELEERTRTNQNELARLNVELSLQMAKYQQAEAAARLSEERFRNLADNIQEGLSIIENGKLVYMNDRVCEIFGHCPEGDLRQRIRDFATPEEATRINALLTKKSPSELQYWIRRPDGKLRCIREHYSTVRSENSRRLFIVTSDVTEQEQAYQNLEQAVSDRTRELSTVLEISQRIASTLELEPLLNLILDQIASIIPYSGAAIYTLEEGSRLKVAAYQLPSLPNIPPSLTLALEHAGRFRPVVTEKRVLVLEDVRGEPPLARAYQVAGIPFPPTVFQHSHSWIGIPLVLRGHVTGLLSLTHEQPGYYTETSPPASRRPSVTRSPLPSRTPVSTNRRRILPPSASATALRANYTIGDSTSLRHQFVFYRRQPRGQQRQRSAGAGKLDRDQGQCHAGLTGNAPADFGIESAPAPEAWIGRGAESQPRIHRIPRGTGN